MKIPESPDGWAEKYSRLSDNDEKLFAYWMETMGSKLPEEFKEKIDFLDYLISFVNDVERKKDQDKIVKLVNEVYSNNRKIVEEENFQYIERHLVDIKLYKKQIKESDFEYFVNYPVDSFDILLRLLKKLAFYNYPQLVSDISAKIYAEVKNTSELIGRAEFDIANFIFFNKWQEVYNKLKEGLDIDKNNLISFMSNYNFDIKEDYDQYIDDLTGEITFSRPEELFKKDVIRFYSKCEMLFMRYMYEEKNLNFIAAREIWYRGINSLLENGKGDIEYIDSLDELFLMDRDIFKNNLYDFIKFMNDYEVLLFAVLWGMPYFYEFLFKKGLITEVIYKSALKIIEWTKEEVMNSYANELWKYNFVHDWEPPASIDQEIFEEEKEMFEKTYEEEVNEIKKKSVDKYEKEKITGSYSDIGRNDSCPCGSGNKYKKCCLNRMEKQQRKKRKQEERKRNLCWTIKEIEQMDTEEIIDRLFYFGVYFNREVFLDDLDEFGSVEKVVNQWYEKFNIDARDFDRDFIKLAPRVLAERI